ncbi:MAG: molybdopterin-dependent oxidoreductase [Thermomicrobiales bacterium]
MEQTTRRHRRIAAVAMLAMLIASMAVLAANQAGRGATLQATPTAGETVDLTGLVEHPAQLTVADLQLLPAQTVAVTFESGEGTQQYSYTGVRVAAVIEQAGLVLNPDQKNDQLRKYLVFTAKDGYETVISWGEIDPNFGNAPYLLAWEEDGQPLTGEDGPIRLVTPGDVRGGRYVTGVIRIEVRDVDSEPRS